MVQRISMETQTLVFNDINHGVPRVFRFRTDLNLYPGFNSQFARTVLKVGAGAFLLDAAEFQNYAIQCNPQP